MIHAREEMTKAKATASKADAEKNYLICCLQSALLENHRLKALRGETGGGGAGVKNAAPAAFDQDEDAICSGIQVSSLRFLYSGILSGTKIILRVTARDVKRLVCLLA